RWGYRRVITPLFEHLETISSGLGADFEKKLMKFVDPSTGDVVALRPDITPQVGRLIASRLREETKPLRLCYNERVIRFEEKGSGKEREVFQVGCELAGLQSAETDAEIIALSIKCLSKVGIKNLVLDIGHNGLLESLLGQTGEARKNIEDALKKKDQEALEQAIKGKKINKHIKDLILMLPKMYGNSDILAKAKRYRLLRKFVQELEDVLSVVDEYNLGCNINVDLGELRGFNYYSGVTFEVLSPNNFNPLIRGGRYDNLIDKYGYDVPATGFAVDVEAVLNITKTHLEHTPVHFVVIPKKDNLRRESIRLAEWLRSSGFKVVLDLKSDANLKKRRIKENSKSNSYGIILLETPNKIKLIESRSGVSREFSDLEELLKGGI
ncbi:MAG: ATP phosphoribosyltransferase regulatory subunit, partial [Candidatus Dadabacteria bacterium]|nr:ATP phosphoribosyltransferase regulatory subunit [Candidatus Dadabacteria bacterium]